MSNPQLFWENVIFFCDVDDTLVTTAKSTPEASEGIRKVFETRFGKEIAKKVQEEFVNIFQTMMLGHQGNTDDPAYQSILTEVKKYQIDVAKSYGRAKLWSREIFNEHCAKKNNINPSSELLSEAIDAYWLQLTKVARVLPGALELVQAAKNHKCPFYLVTGSDARMKLKENGQFFYDPAYSETFKRERMQLLRDKGIDFNLVSIGDPEDKPHEDFFTKAIRMANSDLGKQIDVSRAIMIGDSFAADLQTPKEQLGFGLVVLFEEERKITEIIDNQYMKVGNLKEILKFLN